MRVEFILYVHDQDRSRRFYESLLDRKPSLDVPGMTEFELEGCKLGLMPEKGIVEIVTPALSHPAAARGGPRCELYLLVADAVVLSRRAVTAGATPVSALAARSWGHRVAYFADPDGHVLALADSN